MDGKVTVAVDALGGDNAPEVVLEGVADALAADPDLSVILCGPEEAVSPFAAAHERCRAQATTERIEMAEHPAKAVRRKRDSSIVVGCRLVKEGAAQGFYSAGSTGAVLAAGTLVMGRIKGVSRPALCTVVPSPVSPCVMCDVGANADCKPEYLVQFAHMAALYAERVLGAERPRVGLLNIGEEEEKGSSFALAAYELLKEQVPGFAGNAEGRDIMQGGFDVVVTDGFTGNVALKTLEGTGKVLFDQMKRIMTASPVTMVGALALKGGMRELREKVDPDTYGGAPLLGVRGACIVGHGSASARAIRNGVLVAARVAREDISGMIEQKVSRHPKQR
ncbi:phosphate acyltransferase PlsX [Berryella wangjianweii]|uniref:Phosphate acyltransferase n=1 Tax=Berryella wangjianweii TaxID=2734634 RepID=A0A6M8J475_9ACTN|nr:phosphate acyltransferase PlsX [Berryella wangjianweii]QKF06796.1 phosphate acyltransferase PlsX [Berryella wangjianweii]